MALSQLAISIFILDSDPATAGSQKSLLEAGDHSVEIVEADSVPCFSHITPKDIILIDIGNDTQKSFSILNMFLKTSIRPKLLITAFENQVFERDDFLKGGAAQILFKPFTPSALLSAVADLALTPHG